MKQELSLGDEGEGYQAGRDVAVYKLGLTYADARQIAEDVVRANLLTFVADARQLIDQRVEDLAERLVGRLAAEGADVLASVRDPDVQYSIATAGQQFARTGDSQMGDVLVDLLVDRCKSTTRSLRAVVVNDAIAVAPRLTDGQIAALSIAWRLFRTVNNGLPNIEALVSYIRKDIVPFVGQLPEGDASCLHLVSVGCASYQALPFEYEAPWTGSYPGLFSKGFDELAIPEGVADQHDTFFVSCLRDPSKLQVNAATEQQLNALCASVERLDVFEALKGLLQVNLMTPDEIKAWLKEIDPTFAHLEAVWEESGLGSLQLTSVGIAIAHANYRRVTGLSTDLGVWVS